MTKAQLEELYCHRRLSMMEISRQLQTTHATVLYWLKKHGIPRRSWSESTYAKLNPDGDPFDIQSPATKSQRTLFAAGLLLYWAEGAKTSRTSAKIGNLDGRMPQVFMRFLREVCHADERRMSVYVRVHRQFSLTAARRYWSRLLRLPMRQVSVYPHTDQRSQAHRQWSKYGLAILEFHNTKFKAWLDRAIEEYVHSLANGRGNTGLAKTAWRRGAGLLADEAPELGHSVSADGDGRGRNTLPWGMLDRLRN